MIFWGAQSNKRKPHYAELIINLTKNCFISGLKCTRLHRYRQSPFAPTFGFCWCQESPNSRTWGGSKAEIDKLASNRVYFTCIRQGYLVAFGTRRQQGEPPRS